MTGREEGSDAGRNSYYRAVSRTAAAPRAGGLLYADHYAGLRFGGAVRSAVLYPASHGKRIRFLYYYGGSVLHPSGRADEQFGNHEKAV